MALVALLLALFALFVGAGGLLLLAMPVAPDTDVYVSPELERRVTFLQFVEENPDLSPGQHMEAWLNLKGDAPDNES